MNPNLIFDKEARQTNFLCADHRITKKLWRVSHSCFYEISNDVRALICLNQMPLAFNRRIARLPFLVINLRTDMKRDLMTTANVSDKLIEEFLRVAAGQQHDLREQYLMREAIYSLMRLVRAEQLMDIRNSVKRLIPLSFRATPPRRSRAKRSSPANCSSQHPLAFGKQD